MYWVNFVLLVPPLPILVQQGHFVAIQALYQCVQLGRIAQPVPLHQPCVSLVSSALPIHRLSRSVRRVSIVQMLQLESSTRVDIRPSVERKSPSSQLLA